MTTTGTPPTPAPRTPGRDPRGRQVYRFGHTARATYLAALRDGARLGDAAAAAGVTPRTVRNTIARDPQFADAAAAARTAGRKARTERIPHSEYRYKHHDCRCPMCTTAATRARARCADRSGGPPADVVAIHPPPTGGSKVFPLARAS